MLQPKCRPIAAACVALLVASVTLETPSLANDSGSISGTIVERESGEPIPFANVRLNGVERWTLAERDGTFVIDTLRPGTYKVVVTHVGYHDLFQDGVAVLSGSATRVDFALVARPIRLQEVTVTPGRFSIMETGATSRKTMTREEIQSVPQIGEDVFRAVNRLPGLSSGDYSAHFSIRGGRHDETLILFDGLEIYEPYHLKDFNEGAISIIDSESIDGVDLMTGGFSAKYGNRRSGVFSINSRTPPEGIRHASVGVSFFNARAMMMGEAGDKGHWVASARSGYMDLIFKIINQDDLPSPRYHDVFAKLELELSRNHRLLFDILHAGDTYEFNAASTTGFQDSLKTREAATNRYGNSYAWTVLDSRLGRRVAVRTLASAGLVTRSRDGYESYVDLTDPIYEVTEDRDVSILGLRQDWSLEAGENLFYEAGFDFRRLDGKQSVTSVIGQDPNDPSDDPDGYYPVVTAGTFKQDGTTFAAYLTQRWRPFAAIVFDLGLRHDQASYTSDDDWSPRVNASIQLDRRRALRLGWGYYRQMQDLMDVSLLDPDQTYHKSELTEQWTVGFENTFSKGSLFRFEAYYKDNSNLRPAYRNWKGGIDTFPESNEDRILVLPSHSTAKGIELYYNQRLGTRLHVRGSYGYSIARETVNEMININAPHPLTYDREHPVPQDQAHALNLDLSYRIGSSWSVSGAFAAHSGWPGTIESLVELESENGETEIVILPNKIYGEQLPAYYRMDARLTRRWPAWGGHARFFFELVNMTNHSNVFGYDYYRDLDPNGNFRLQREEETWFTILPTLGVAWTREF